jgi:hypothetical protein
MLFSSNTRKMAGIILLTVPTIAYGGTFLLSVISGQVDLPLTEFQKSMFRAGHAHAGVLVLLSLIVQPFLDDLVSRGEWFLRGGIPLASILISGGFFAAAIGENRITPNEWIAILWAGVAVLVLTLLITGIQLLRKS